MCFGDSPQKSAQAATNFANYGESQMDTKISLQCSVPVHHLAYFVALVELKGKPEGKSKNKHLRFVSLSPGMVKDYRALFDADMTRDLFFFASIGELHVLTMSEISFASTLTSFVTDTPGFEEQVRLYMSRLANHKKS